MARRFVIVLATAATLAVTAAPHAWAVVQASGTGQTPLSAAFGFNADETLNGQFIYISDPAGPNAGFNAQCNDFDSFTLEMAPGHFPKVVVSATCVQQGEVDPVFLWASFVDRGEPGDKDSVCICWTFAPIPRPLDTTPCFITDKGKIESGNIQIQTT
jgi:hypothetical protein